MTSHSYHPDSHEAGLAYDCERCEEHAMRPLDGLDDRNVSNLITRLRAGDPARTNNEDGAMRVIGRAMGRASRLYDCGWRP